MARSRNPAPVSPPKLDGSAGAYLFYGPEPFLRRLYLAQLTRRVLGQADPAMAVTHFEGNTATLAGVLDELRTLPFLADRRVVIVQDADPFISEHRAALERYVEKPCETGVLVLMADRSQGNTNLQKKIASLGGAVPCEKLAQSELAGWIRNRAKDAYHKSIDYETASLLADLIGEDLDRLDSELNKLATYLGETRKTITTADVDELVANQRMHEAFELTGAIASKDLPEALTRWNDMLAKDSDAPYRTVSLIAWQIRQMLRARMLRSQGLSRDQVLGKLRIPYHVRDRFVEQVARFSDRRLRALLRELVSIDLAAKTGGAPPERGIEQFIITACELESAGR